MTKLKSVIIPPAIDLHVHFREPSTNKAENFRTGSRAALLGGYGAVCDMPNNPGSPTWSVEALADKHRRISKSSYIGIATYAGSQPESDNLDQLAAMSELSIGLKLYGAFTTGNAIDYDPQQFKPTIKKWHEVAPDKPIMLHSGKENLKDFIDLIANQGKHHLHICHINSPRDVELVTKAKKRGFRISCGVCPHHLFKTSHDEVSQGWFARMLPSLANQSEAETLFKMLVNGDIDVLETDHAPHEAQNKWQAEQANPKATQDQRHVTCFGVPGIEFALPLLFYQMLKGRIKLNRMVKIVSQKPAQIIGLKMSPKSKATWDLKEYRIDSDRLATSGSKWTPYLGFIAAGRVKKLTVKGKLLVENYEVRHKNPAVIDKRGTLI